MNKLKKIGLTALGTSLVVSSAYAGDLSVTGAATLEYTSKNNTSDANPLSMNNSIKFNGSGDLDNGLSVSAYWELDDDVMDDYNMTITLPNDFGSIKVVGASGLAGGLGTVGDIVPSAAEEVYDATDGVDYGIATYSLAQTTNVGYTWSGNGLMISAQHNPSNGTNNTSSETTYGATLEVPGMDGLMLAAGTGSDAANTDINTLGAKYTVGAVTAAYQWTEIDQVTQGYDEVGNHYGISFAVNENLSLSAGKQETEFRQSPTKVDEKNTGYSASYTTGGMTVKYSFNEVEAPAGDATAKDIQLSYIQLGFAF